VAVSAGDYDGGDGGVPVSALSQLVRFCENGIAVAKHWHQCAISQSQRNRYIVNGDGAQLEAFSGREVPVNEIGGEVLSKHRQRNRKAGAGDALLAVSGQPEMYEPDPSSK